MIWINIGNLKELKYLKKILEKIFEKINNLHIFEIFISQN